MSGDDTVSLDEVNDRRGKLPPAQTIESLALECKLLHLAREESRRDFAAWASMVVLVTEGFMSAEEGIAMMRTLKERIEKRKP